MNRMRVIAASLWPVELPSGGSRKLPKHERLRALPVIVGASRRKFQQTRKVYNLLRTGLLYIVTPGALRGAIGEL